MIDKIYSFREMMDFICKQYANNTAFSVLRKGFHESITYSKFGEDVNNLSNSLKVKNVPIAIFSENTYELIVLYFSIVISGNIVIPLDTSASVDSVISELESSKCSIILCSERYFGFLKCMQENSEKKISVVLISDIFKTGSLEESVVCPQTDRIHENDTNIFDNSNVIIYTSGTTSEPKGVMLTQKNIISDAVSTSKKLNFCSKVLLILPVYHAFGLTVGVILPLLEGCEIVLCDGSYTIMKCVQISKAESTIAVPAIMRMFHDNIIACNGNANVMGNIKQIVCGGAMLSADLYDFFEGMGMDIRVGYGLTECAPVVSMNGNEIKKRGSAGQILDCCAVKIQKPDQKGCGEILVKGTNVTKGYLNSPQDTIRGFESGYFKTGDIGSIDDDGFLFITGRRKNTLVLSNGKKVAPEELESYISVIPYVKEVVIFLTKKSESREAIVAEVYIEEKDNYEESRKKVLQEVGKLNGKLPIYKRINEVLFREFEFKKTSTKKIIRISEKDTIQNEIAKPIIGLISELTDVTYESIRIESDLFDELELDSLNFMSLLCELSERHEVEFFENDIRAIRTVWDLSRLIYREKMLHKNKEELL